jgi:hypothetical protein
VPPLGRAGAPAPQLQDREVAVAEGLPHKLIEWSPRITVTSGGGLIVVRELAERLGEMCLKFIGKAGSQVLHFPSRVKLPLGEAKDGSKRKNRTSENHKLKPSAKMEILIWRAPVWAHGELRGSRDDSPSIRSAPGLDTAFL